MKPSGFHEIIRRGEEKHETKILKRHDDVDLTVRHDGTEYVVTTDGNVFKQLTARDLRMEDFIKTMRMPKRQWRPAPKRSRRGRVI